MVGNSKTSEKSDERSPPRPQSLPIGKREDPGVDGEILVPDFTLTANFKMAAKERMKQVIFIQLLRFSRISELPVLFSLLRDLRNRGRLEVE